MKTTPHWRPITELRVGMLAVWQDDHDELHLGGDIVEARKRGSMFFEFDRLYPLKCYHPMSAAFTNARITEGGSGFQPGRLLREATCHE